uniref:Sugar phosphate exchanger 3 n=1 Tax=Magallana gigas TaxID=29159 RepID=K1PQX4_MAGGI
MPQFVRLLSCIQPWIMKVFVFGVVFEWVHFYNKYVYVIIWILNGLLQSMGWPTVVAIMGNWFGRHSRGLVLGIWSACASVGNIIGAFLVSGVLDYGYDHHPIFPAVGLSIPDEDSTVHPKEYSVVINEGESNGNLSDDGDDPSRLINNRGVVDNEDAPLLNPVVTRSDSVLSDDRPAAISFCSALCLPGVALYALAYACLKLVNYSFFFWLPYYLHNKYGWKETVADDISIWYDVGGIIDSDLSSTLTMNGLLMAVVGFFIGGVANLVSAAISADLGKQGPVQGNSEALATVTGIVDGTGSVGAAIGQVRSSIT